MILTKVIRKLMAIFFQLLYHQFAWMYDFVAWSASLGQWNEWVLTPLPYLKNGTILELGFGPGHLQQAAFAQGHPVFGLDLSPQMAKIATKRLTKNGYDPRLTIGDGRNLPFADQSIDQIIATFPTEYFLDPKTLEEANRVLSSEGEIILVPTAWIQGNNLLHKLMAWVFIITGQSLEKEHPLFETGKMFIEKFGFEVSMHSKKLQKSEVFIITARKKG